MKRIIAASICAAISALSFGANLTLVSGGIPLPNADGSFNTEKYSTGHSVRHAYFILDETQYAAYENDEDTAFAIFEDFLAGTLGLETVYDKMITTGGSRVKLAEQAWNSSEYGVTTYGDYYDNNEDAYFAAVFVYESEESGLTNFISTLVHCVTLSVEEEETILTNAGKTIDKIAFNVGHWNVIRPVSAITFDNGAGEGGATEAVGTYGLLPDAVSVPVLENKVFGGYYDAPDGAGVRYFDENGEPTMAWDKTDGEVTLYAKWSSNIVTVIFLANGGSGAMDEIFFQPGDSVELPENLFARGDYAFAGWSFSETGGVAYPDKWEGELLDSLGSNPVAGDAVSLYAVWAPVTFNVKFSANGGKGAMAAQKFRTGTASALRANAFTRSGYVFLGWAKSAALAGKWSVAWKNKQTVRDLVSSGKTVTLYAVWAKAKYKVGYNAYGGTLPKGVKMAAQTHAYGTAAKLAKNQFTRSGYVFAGWATSKANAKSGVIAYGNAQKVKNLTPKGGTVTLYAVWAKPKYKIAFYANGGKGATVVQTVKYGKAVNLAKCKFIAPKGRKFAGWATSAAKAKAGKVKYKNKAAVKNLLLTGKTVKLYAIWKKQ